MEKEILKMKAQCQSEKIDALTKALVAARETYDAINEQLQEAINERAETVAAMMR